ncbi:putative bifunctional diguanylate cyclase/phosphodiesterase [Curvibacter gracilis]|uniref:putative bifunctional diguanylate cyclase/phosphodiesterase n=1 Tax=Curvibacter gracilis TaxID=230310 RepID=UPI0004B21EC4|nr:GGDEF and EAL domain-containing protein [Curvibacter gracilis]
MNLQTPARPEGASTLTQQETRLLNEEVLTLVYGSTRRSTLVALLVATTILTLQHQYALLAPWWAWAGLAVLSYGARELLARSFRSRLAAEAGGANWLLAYRVSTAACGAVWGLSGWLFYPGGDTVSQAFLVVILVGVSSGGIMAYLIDPPCGRLFCAGIYLLALPGFLAHGSSFSISLALMLALFMGYISLSSASMSHHLRENISLRILANQRSQAVHEMAERQALHIQQTPMGVVECDTFFRVTVWNAAAEAMFGYSAQEMLGQSLSLVMPPWERERSALVMRHLFMDGMAQNNQSENLRKDGQIIICDWYATPLKDIDGRIIAAAALVVDKTEAQKNLEAVHQLAYYDMLTGLPNRRLLLDRIEQAFALSSRQQDHGAVVFLDLDRFKTLNDMKGHSAGDLLLKLVGTRLREMVRSHDTVSRFGGDEFVVVLQGLGDSPEAAVLACRQVSNKIIAELNKPFDISGYDYQTSPSLGVCLFHAHDLGVNEVLKRADMAMYQAKQAGRNTVCFYDQTLQPQLEARANLEADLRHAIAQSALVAYYQLQVDGQGEVLGAELLLRWRHPCRGWVSPADFIPIAEESSLICEIGEWVMLTACRQLRTWQSQPGMQALRLSINVSARQVEKSDFIESVARCLDTTGCPPALLRLELTEGLMLRRSDELIAKLQALHAMGLSLSIDDFGTGYSSLSMLKHFPLDELKIDRSFISDLPGNTDDATLIKTIIAMGRNLGLEVIAEGVETPAQFEFLRQSGCMAYQGYLFGRPVPIEAFERQLAERVTALPV